MKTTKDFNATLSISEVHCTDMDDYVQIEIGDEDSGCLIAKVKMTHEEYARASFSRTIYDLKGSMGDLSKLKE